MTLAAVTSAATPFSLPATRIALCSNICSTGAPPSNPLIIASRLAAKVRGATAHPVEMRQMGLNARKVYEKKYTPEANYRQLIAIYQEAMEEKRRNRH